MSIASNIQKIYEEAIYKGMSRTLWLMAYVDWVENEEQTENEEGQEQFDIEHPPGGGDWDDYAPATPIGAVQAAHDIGKLIGKANGFHDKDSYPLARLFEQAMAIHLGEPINLYDEPWHSQLVASPNDRDLRMVYADWLEGQGRTFDADYVRDATRAHTWRASTPAHIGDAERFGGTLAHSALGSGVWWGDDHTTKRDGQEFDPEMPSFECYYDGNDLNWSGRIMNDKDVRPSHASGQQQARFQGYDQPTLTVAIGEDTSTQPKIIYVNENEEEWAKHSFVLWFGQVSPTYLMIYAQSLQDAFDEGIDWLVDNEPGQLVDDQVNEEFRRLQAEREAELGRPLTWEADNEEMSNIAEEAEVDTSSGGNASNRIDSHAWGIVAEDPTPTDLLRLAGLIQNNPAALKRKTNPPRPKQSPADQLATVLFRDSVTARMLRELAERGEMTQADFMREYMRRCERETLPRYRAETPAPGTYWTPGDKPLSSGFLNNFGRYVRGSRWGAGWGRVSTVPRLIEQVAWSSSSGHARSAPLRWVGPPIDEILQGMSPAKRQWAYESLERQLTSGRQTDDPAQTARWIARIQQYLTVSNPARGRRHYQPVR